MILDDLAGGKFKPAGIQQSNPEQKKYSIFIQFDGDEPRELYQNIDINNRFHLTLNGPGPQSEFVFTDNITGKKFKLFAK